MTKLEGKITVEGLPPHLGLTIDLCFFPVSSEDAPAPFDGEPPAEVPREAHKVYKEVHLERESAKTSVEVPFAMERLPGFYYLELRALLFRREGGRVFAQAEQFFFKRRPLRVADEGVGVLELPVRWPPTEIKDMQHFGTVRPANPRPWWKFW